MVVVIVTAFSSVQLTVYPSYQIGLPLFVVTVVVKVMVTIIVRVVVIVAAFSSVQPTNGSSLILTRVTMGRGNGCS